MLLGQLARLVPVGLGRADEGLGVSAGPVGQLLRLPLGLGDPGLGGVDCGVGVGLRPPDGLVGACLRLHDPGLSVGADLLGLGGMRGGGLGQLVVSFACTGLLGGQVLAHLLGGLICRGAHLIGGGGAALSVGPLGLGGGGPLFGCCPRRLDFGLGRGGVADGGHGGGEPLGGGGDRARQFAHLPQELGAGDPGHGDGLLGLGLAGGDAALGVGQPLALPPRGHGGMCRVRAVLGPAAWLGGSGLGCVLAAGELAGHGGGRLGHGVSWALVGAKHESISFHFITLGVR